MKHFVLSIIFAVMAIFSASAGIVAETADSIAAIEGITFVDGTAEAKKDADVKFAKVYIAPSDKAESIKALFDALPDDMLAIDVAEGNDIVKMWVEPINDIEAETIFSISSGDQNIVVYICGNLDDIKKHVNVGGN